MLTSMFVTLSATLLLVAAATLAERALLWLRRPTRGVWLAVMGVGTLLPLLYPSLLSQVRAAGGGAASVALGRLPDIVISGPAGAGQLPLGAASDATLLALWIAASVLVLARLAFAAWRLRSARREWQAGTVDGEAVWLADDFGPALAGVHRPQIVVPHAVCALPQAARRVVLQHEREHRAAGDQWLLFAAHVAIVLVPWNAALWYARRRLRLAIELDCDARVLRRESDVRAYALLLLHVAGWRHRRETALALGESGTHHLERRLTVMTDRTPQRVLRPALLLCASLALTLVACDVALPPAASDDVPQVDSARAQIAPTEPFFEFQVDEPVSVENGSATPRYPAHLREAGIEGDVLVQFVVNTDGRADESTFRVLKSRDSAFTAAVQRALPGMRFTPARRGGTTVQQVVQQPFSFRIAR